MTREEEEKSPRLFDNRTIERNIRKGLITRKDYDKYLKSLPDVSDKIAPADAPRSALGAAAEEPDDLDNLDLDSPDEATEPVNTVAAETGAAGAEDEDEDDDMEDDIPDEDEEEADDGASGDEKPPTT